MLTMIEFPMESVRLVARHYTREAGVRKLEQQYWNDCRKVARKIAEGATEKVTITPEVIHEFLGGIKVRVDTEIAERTKRPGVAVGLAWTPAGGDVLFIEANKMKGKGGFTITGQIGDVMKESMQAALTWVRSNAGRFGLEQDFTKDTDIHIHVPAGAIPKDGPSAGITMATALVSLLDGHSGASADGDDGRDYAERQRAAGGRHQGEVPCGQARRSARRDSSAGVQDAGRRGPDAGPDRRREDSLRDADRGGAGDRTAEDGAGRGRG